MRSLVFLPAAAFLFLACGGAEPDRSYAGTARYRYEQGVEALDDDNYLEAVKHFTFVKNKFAYSKYAALAELRIADTYFDQGKHIEAIDSYRLFVQGRPNHREVSYAMWRVSLSYYEQMPSDFFLFPPSHEKDQAATKDALRALRKYVERFPKGEHVGDANERILDARRALADYEMYVARFYLGQERAVSARGRLETLHKDFSDVPELWRAASLMLTEVYAGMEQPDEAKRVAAALIAQHPASDEAQAARALVSP
jgi:outer membrane protein assembly factor BamD